MPKLETSVIYRGDNKDVLAAFPSKSVDLIYADPPFFSNKHYEIVWGNGAEMKVFEDRWKGGINVYVEWMKERLIHCHRVLKDTGSLYLHCDWHADAHLRILLDGLFGPKNFLNEIIWCYNVGGKGSRHWARKHDTLLFYAKSSNWFFDGRAVGIKRETGTKSFGGIIGVDEQGRRYQDKLVKATGKYYRYYLDDPKIPEDWWVGINSIQSQSAERLDYPTQKPEALLERIILASSKKNHVVLDPFAGGGTTAVVSHRLGRKWIAVDVSPLACKKMRERLAKAGAQPFRVIGAPKTVSELKALQPFHFQNWVIDRIGGQPTAKKTGDMGIDGYTFLEHLPVQVKQSEGVGRNVVDNFETAVKRRHAPGGYIIAFGFVKGAYEEAARAKREDQVDIKLVRVDELDKHF